MKVAVIGTGYVGLVTGVVLAQLGNDVICVDKDAEKVAKLRQGIPPIYEPGIEEMLRHGLEDGFLTISDSIAEAVAKSEIVFIAVGTPPGEDGTPDMTFVRAVANEIAPNIKRHTVIVNKSTVPVGSGDMVEEIVLSHGVEPHLFDVVSNPEFLREGSAIRDTLEPDRVVIGAKRRDAALRLVELYAPLERPMLITDLASAELIKYASNSFLAAKISFINAISRLCETCGADVRDVAKGMGYDRRIGAEFLQAGLGWGGSCFPKDVQGLLKVSETLGYEFDLLQSVIDINSQQVERFVARLENRLGGFAGKRVAIMGLAFKPNTDDIRDAKSLDIIRLVTEKGATVCAHDPIAVENVRKVFPNIDCVDGVYDVSKDADALVIVTEWNEYRHLDLARLGFCMKEKVMFDGRRLYRRDAAERAGFDYFTIGG